MWMFGSGQDQGIGSWDSWMFGSGDVQIWRHEDRLPLLGGQSQRRFVGIGRLWVRWTSRSR